MVFSRFSIEKLLYTLVNRTVIFFFVMCLLTLALYAAGTIQGFVDSTQLFLLTLYEGLGFFLMVTSFCGIVLDFERFFRVKRKRYLFRSLGYLLLLVFSITTVFAVMSIIALSRGSGAI
jgi:hypothetical protein